MRGRGRKLIGLVWKEVYEELMNSSGLHNDTSSICLVLICSADADLRRSLADTAFLKSD